MSTDLYPHNLQEWIALIGVLIPLLGLAGGAMWRAWTYHRERRQSEWERLHELLKTLYNKDNDYGMWAQLAATYELECVRIDKALLSQLVSDVLAHWKKSNANARLIEEATKLKSRLGR